ncbi:BnaA02g24740D [Brassica napus]|uniref:BnaA02g24740D protein n=1 Tax=Brassica napus TaxID=3708 RepID=A0A078HFI8_BRANA|nr:BnaA02g24740D [Brassica napus]
MSSYVATDNYCPRCGELEETVTHAIFKCPPALQVCRISDNNFNGIIPGYIGNWSGLLSIHLYASGLKGPIPNAIFRLKNLRDL